MNRHVVAGMIGLALAGCSLERSGAKRANPNLPTVEMTPPLPSIHEAINQENPEVDPTSLPAVVSRAPAPRQVAGAPDGTTAPVGDEAPPEDEATAAPRVAAVAAPEGEASGPQSEVEGRPAPFLRQRPVSPRPRASDAVASSEPTPNGDPSAAPGSTEVAGLPPAAEAPAETEPADPSTEAVPIRRRVPLTGEAVASEETSPVTAPTDAPVIDAVPSLDPQTTPAPVASAETPAAAPAADVATAPPAAPASAPAATASRTPIDRDPLLGPNPALMPQINLPAEAAGATTTEATPPAGASAPVTAPTTVAESTPAPVATSEPAPAAAVEPTPATPAAPEPAPVAAVEAAPTAAPVSDAPATPTAPSPEPGSNPPVNATANATVAAPVVETAAPPSNPAGAEPATEKPQAAQSEANAGGSPATAPGVSTAPGVPVEAAPAEAAAQPTTPADSAPGTPEGDPTIPAPSEAGGRAVPGRPPQLLPNATEAPAEPAPPAESAPAQPAEPVATAPAAEVETPVAATERAELAPAAAASNARPQPQPPAPPAEPPPPYRFNFDVHARRGGEQPNQDAIFGAPSAPPQAVASTPQPATATNVATAPPRPANEPRRIRLPQFVQRPTRATAGDAVLGPNGELLPSATRSAPASSRLVNREAKPETPAEAKPTPSRVASGAKTDEKTRAAGTQSPAAPDPSESPVELPPLSGPEATNRRIPGAGRLAPGRPDRPRIVRVSYQPPARDAGGTGSRPEPAHSAQPNAPTSPVATRPASNPAPGGAGEALALPEALMPGRPAPTDPARTPAAPVAQPRPAAGSAAPATRAPETMSLRQVPERSVFEEGMAAAHVGNEVITLLELKKAVRLRRRSLPNGPLRPEDNYALAKSVLDELVDRTIVTQEARRLIKDPKQLQMFTKQADKMWLEEELPPLLRQTSSANIYELKQKLAERDESLDEIREAFRQEFLFRGFLEFKIGPRLRVDLPEMIDYYREHLRDFNQPAMITWREIVVEVAKHNDRATARRRADLLLSRLARGEDLAALAHAESDGPNKAESGLWHTSPGGYAVAEVNAVLETLPAGRISSVIESPSSFHIVRVESRRAAGPATFAEVQDQIKKAIRAEKVTHESNTYLNRLRKATVVRTVFDDPAVRRAATTAVESSARSGWDTAPRR
ncbi:MAG: peptidyl-prolyl cis-trans isomerase [Isosphaeraceae bacterium]